MEYSCQIVFNSDQSRCIKCLIYGQLGTRWYLVGCAVDNLSLLFLLFISGFVRTRR